MNTINDELNLAFMDLEKEFYKIKHHSSPNVKYIVGLLEYIEQLQNEMQAIPCNAGTGCICLNRDYANGLTCKVFGLDFKLSVGCKYFMTVESFTCMQDGRKKLND